MLSLSSKKSKQSSKRSSRYVDLHFVDVGDPSPKYLSVKDYNQQWIQVPYADEEDSLDVFFKNYLLIPKCAFNQQNANKSIHVLKEQKEKKNQSTKFLRLKNFISCQTFKKRQLKIKQLKKYFNDRQMKIVYSKDEEEQMTFVPQTSQEDFYNLSSYKQDKNSALLQITISFSNWDRSITQFDLKARVNDPIAIIKEKIAQRMKVKSQNLSVSFKGDTLKNCQTLQKHYKSKKNIFFIFFQDDEDNIQLSVCYSKPQLYSYLIYIQPYIRLDQSQNGYEKKQRILSGTNNQYENIGQILNQTLQRINLKGKNYKLTYQQKTLDSSKTLKFYSIKSRSTLCLIPNNISSLSKLKSSYGIKFKLKIGTYQYLDLYFNDVKNMTVNQLLSEHDQKYKNKQKVQQFWALCAQNQLLLPYEKISCFQQIIKNGHQVQVIKNKRFFFYSKIKQKIDKIFIRTAFFSEQFEQEQEKQKIKQKINSVCDSNSLFESKRTLFTNEDFIFPIYCYGQNQHYQGVNNFLRNTNINQSNNYTENKYFKFTNSLIASLSELPNYQKIVYRGWNSKYTQINKKAKEGQIICFDNFTSTSKSKSKAQRFLQDQTNIGTIFIINSLTGKQVQYFCGYDEEEVLFTPCTYFHIDNIYKKQNIDQIYLTQLSTPSRFKEIRQNRIYNIILWVDDQPDNNIQLINKLSTPNLQFIQVTSTRQACLWMNHFYELIKLLGIKLRVVSDMVRKHRQYNYDQGRQIQVTYYTAGIDLLFKLNNEHNYNVPILIYCFDQEKARRNVQMSGIKINQNIWSVTIYEQDVKHFCKFQRKIFS